MKCPYCNHHNHGDVDYCERCGAQLTDVHYCEHCGTLRQRGAAVCPVCGKAYAETGKKLKRPKLWKPAIFSLIIFVLIGTFSFLKRRSNVKYEERLNTEYAVWKQTQQMETEQKSKKKNKKKSGKDKKKDKKKGKKE